MKKLISIGLLCLLVSCKKTDYSPANFQVQVSGLTAKTSVSITVKDITENSTILTVVNQFGNNTYNSTTEVHPGDQLSIMASSNVNDDVSGDGDGTLKYYFKGQQMGAHGGEIGVFGFSENETVPQP
ncbi:hypothetical protein HDF19_10090 [Mucilaginibacter sp. E4BP6]|uniref:hypothetical protein n=1 Tax=Mucilaginibacter sp. E4BP6 TaxID=2723089 RepID=UPI0015CA811D|nr:hypothetical protein [Mucilaginibacter sp. E4BP6]NYE68667.1 hypothetical protein [Mucilaginibacter sp. E4BP6]